MLSSDRFVGALVVGKGETAHTPQLTFNGVDLPTDDALSDEHKGLLRSAMISGGLFDPLSQDIFYFQTTSTIDLDEGSGSLEVAAEKFTGSMAGGATLESDLDDGAPLDKLETFMRQVAMPVAAAGTGYTAECARSRTSIRLDGTGSHAVSGGTLAYIWSSTCPGATFDDPTSPTPLLTIDTSCGCQSSCGVQLIVSEGVLSSASSAMVQIVDTSAPVISCPSDALVECRGGGGVANTDPEIVAFLAAAQARDECDPTAGLTHDAPSFFPLGTTLVTFKSRDVSGNGSECSAHVTVADRTPPALTVSVAPRVLWPPTHKLVPVHAAITFSDVCDGSPTLQLLDITSNEPIHTQGDGNTAPDVTDAAFGTDDRDVQVRSERSGGGDGRIYRICYRATDGSNNSSTVCDSVIVLSRRPGRSLPSRQDPLSSSFQCAARSEPANSRVVFQFSLPQNSQARLTIYDVTGRQVSRPLDGPVSKGVHEAFWRPGRSGVYLYRLEAVGTELTGRVAYVQ